ncbi:MAG: alpha/beta hydrolase [Terracidiphilus sp.]
MKWARRVLWAALALAAIAGTGFLLRPVSYFDGWMYLREDLGGIESRYAPIGRYRVHYLAEGPENGPVVVLVHGLGGRAEDWSNLAPYLVRAGFRVYMPDLIGYGRSQRPKDFSYTVREEAAVVLGFMDALGLKQVDLGGWSMGGWIAQLVTLEHPERVQRLMLFDSAGLDVKPRWDTALFTPDTTAQLAALDVLLMPRPPAVPPFVARDIVRLSRENSWVIKRSMASMLTAQDVTDNLLPQLKMPVLLAWGSLDQIVPLDQAQTMHRLIPQSQLDVFDGCGHLAPTECARQMGPKVVEFAEQ